MLTDCLLVLCHFSTVQHTTVELERVGSGRKPPLSCNQGDWKSTLQQRVVQGFSRATCPAQYDMSGATKSRELSGDVRLHEEEKNSENNNAGLLVLGRDGITAGNFVNLSICEQSHRVRHI